MHWGLNNLWAPTTITTHQERTTHPQTNAMQSSFVST
jgi:hypothetical protein